MNRTDLPIPTPCAADWTTMTLADRGRFCGACKKVVRELAQLTEIEARALLASPPTEALCVRYLHDATGEILFRHPDVVPLGHLARFRRGAAAALATASIPLALAGCMGAPAPLMGSPVPPSNPTMGAVTTPAKPPPAPTTSASPEATTPTAPEPR
jgi:hypothetical protein